MEKRNLGRTGHRSTLITLGGAAVRPTGLSAQGLPNTREESEAFIEHAMDHGVNHIDVAPTYGSGMAETILGRWLKEHRENLFLGCKTQKRTKKEAAEELNASLKRLQLHTTHILRKGQACKQASPYILQVNNYADSIP